ncbi:hypothetical protein JQ557_14070 [Bradyrhizobium sp. U87765 SZCCT0131]|uniref:hypothetical protein n=1 Tax=unclassified Bradyrhizobium TaxID=2631580 RepID=UPI001BAAD987|nr:MULTISPECIES: hypothetical protein [unclassified Bradyrhizobium]MBR1219126.1 hypothetical protein [Bradyrhizobium sp. U87765 SZCCT0131]MBR1261777.1 hypothetical protein [Bradyrhizobium sp. U87765 SZCCT0134]MBR1306370.1 hypothetical protein [Bradyrhizobium sp. U87765 SZCCT0110]MBR1317559.1 hypothetical protein [Bradyrhizobium sp. U87765 SZCCT0109]MBR1351261.1 hypothetical protein [Bradyrhizobium sp. U87765 SZCCT0048]
MKPSSRRLGLLLLATTLAALLAGCVSDGIPLGTSSISNDQLRYYGGPREPRWPVTP